MPELEVLEAHVPVRTPRSNLGLAREPETAATRLAPVATWFSGPVFSRARDIFAANMAELLDRSEDPAKMIRMIIIEMDIKEMRRTLGRLEDLRTDWTLKAELALSKDRDDLARAALVERQKAADMAADVNDELQQMEQVLRGYEVDLARLQAKLREARARQNAIAARIESAVARAKAREIMHGSRTEEAFSKFEILERRADFAEGRAEALGMTCLENEIDQLRADEAVNQELDAMKAALKTRSSKEREGE